MKLPRSYTKVLAANKHLSPVARRGLERNYEQQHKSWEQPPLENLSFWIRFQIPFDYAASKNAFQRKTNQGRVYLTTDGNAFRRQIHEAIFQALHPESFLIKEGVDTSYVVPGQWNGFYQNKVWLDLQVEKPDHRGDAINLIDLTADAIKESIAVDDRFFCIRRVDWRIVKRNPVLIVTILQDARWHGRICSSCGLLINKIHFTKQSSVCRFCRHADKGDAHAKT